MATVTPDHQVGTYDQFAIRRLCSDSGNCPVLLNQLNNLRLHAKVELGVHGSALSEKIEKVPLGHEDDEFCMSGQSAEVGNPKTEFPDLRGEMIHFLMRSPEKVLQLLYLPVVFFAAALAASAVAWVAARIDESAICVT